MVTKDEAMAIVQQRLDASLFPNDRIVVSRVDEHSWGWVFFYNSRRCIDTRDIRHALAGNVPLFVTRDDGVLHGPVAGSGVPVEEHLRLVEHKVLKR